MNMYKSNDACMLARIHTHSIIFYGSNSSVFPHAHYLTAPSSAVSTGSTAAPSALRAKRKKNATHRHVCLWSQGEGAAGMLPDTVATNVERVVETPALSSSHFRTNSLEDYFRLLLMCKNNIHNNETRSGSFCFSAWVDLCLNVSPTRRVPRCLIPRPLFLALENAHFLPCYQDNVCACLWVATRKCTFSPLLSSTYSGRNSQTRAHTLSEDW